MHDLYKLKETLVKELEEMGKSGDLSKSALEDIDKLAHAAKNVAKVIEACEEEEYSNAMGRGRSYRGGSYRDGRSYEGMSNRQYSRDGYYYDDGGMSTRRGRAANGRFVSRDSSNMARQLREMMNEAEDDYTRSELQKLADKMEQM